MKQLSTFAFVTAAVAALIFVGASSASASVLCQTNTTPCGSPFTAGTTYSATLKSGTQSTLAAGFSTIKCSESSMALEQTSTGGFGIAVVGHQTSMSFSFCNATVEVEALGSWLVYTGTNMNGGISTGGAEVEIVAGTTHCRYRGEISSGLEVIGGAPATLVAKNAELRRVEPPVSSRLCAEKAKWNAEYVFAQNVWVAEA